MDDLTNVKSADIYDILDEIDQQEQQIEASTNKNNQNGSKPKQSNKKKKLDPEARMQKLLAKQNKRHNKQQNGTSYNYEEDTDSNLDPDTKAWKEFTNLLCIKGIVLRPQIIFDFIVLEVMAFCGGNVTITMAKDVNTNDSDSMVKDATISRIEGFIPIINNPKYYALNKLEEKDDEKGSTSSVSLRHIDQNTLGFGIISKRSSKMGNKRKTTWNMLDYTIFPSFLSKSYKWTINDNLCFTTLYKNFEDDHKGGAISYIGSSNSRKKVDDTYYMTGNIVNGFIVFLNESMTKKLCIIQTPHSLFYVDDRVKYRNLKVPMGIDKFNNKVAVCQNLWNKPTDDDVIQVWLQGHDHTNLFVVTINGPNSNNTGNEKIKVMEIVTNMKACAADQYHQFGATMDQISDELNADHLKKYPFQPFESKDDDETGPNPQDAANPLLISNAKAEEYNQILKQNKLLKVVSKYKYIDCNHGASNDEALKKSLLKPFTKRFTLNTVYLDQQQTEKSKIATLYMLGERLDTTAKWKLFMRVTGDNVNEKIVENYNKRYMKFIAANKEIVEEGCDILFCDERIKTEKKLIGIFGESMLVLPCYKNDVDYGMDEDGKDDGKEFAKIYNVKDVIPDLFSVELITSKSKYINDKTTNIVRGGKWYYSYNTQTLYVFERISTSGKNPFRLRRLFLHTFKF